VGNPSTKEVIAMNMKKMSILILITVLGIGGWALPAGAEKIRLTDVQLDEITAGSFYPCGQVCVSFSKTGDAAGAGINATGGLTPPQGNFMAGGGTPLLGGVYAKISATGHLSFPMGNFSVIFQVPKGIPQCIGFGPGVCPVK
jgi:hypothetical protein